MRSGWDWSSSAIRSHLGQVVRVREVDDVLAVVGGEQHEHGLAAEEVLVGDVVLGDLVAGVEVAVLAGDELELGRAVAGDQGEQQADDRHQAGPLAELDGEPGPEPLHAGEMRRLGHGPSSEVRAGHDRKGVANASVSASSRACRGSASGARRRRPTQRSSVSTGCTPGMTRTSSTSQAGVAVTPCSRAMRHRLVDGARRRRPRPGCSATSSIGAPASADELVEHGRGRRGRGRRPSGRGRTRRRRPGSASGVDPADDLGRLEGPAGVGRAGRARGTAMPLALALGGDVVEHGVEPAAGPHRPALGRDLGVQVVGQVGHGRRRGARSTVGAVAAQPAPRAQVVAPEQGLHRRRP